MGEGSRLSVYSGLEYCLINFLLIVLSFDNWRIYIYGMKKTKDIEDKFFVKSAVLGMVVPFVLFWVGVFVPAFIDGLFAFVVCLVPFYSYMIVMNQVLESDKMHESEEKIAECEMLSGFWALSYFFAFLTSFLCLVDVDKDAFFYYPSLVMMFNSVPSFVLCILAGFDHGTRFARPLLYW